jgi:hypothetical protein
MSALDKMQRKLRENAQVMKIKNGGIAMIIYLYPEHGHERLAIDSEELDKQIAWLHEQTMCDENEGIWNLLETIRDMREVVETIPVT